MGLHSYLSNSYIPMTNDEVKHLQQLASELPVLETGPGKAIYYDKLGGNLNKAEIKLIINTSKFPVDWKPNPKIKYRLGKWVPPYPYPHLKMMIQVFKDGGMPAVEEYMTDARNAAAAIAQSKNP